MQMVGNCEKRGNLSRSRVASNSTRRSQGRDIDSEMLQDKQNVRRRAIMALYHYVHLILVEGKEAEWTETGEANRR